MELIPLPSNVERKILRESQYSEGPIQQVMSILKHPHEVIVELYTQFGGEDADYEQLRLTHKEWEFIGQEMGWLD